MEELPLQMAIGFFGLMVAAWAGLCLYLRATHQKRAEDAAIEIVADISDDEIAAAQAA
jgi:hypothetical protein